MSNYGQGLPVANLFGAFSRASESYANQPQIQNARIKAISSLPVDYTKEEISLISGRRYNVKFKLLEFISDIFP